MENLIPLLNIVGAALVAWWMYDTNKKIKRLEYMNELLFIAATQLAERTKHLAKGEPVVHDPD